MGQGGEVGLDIDGGDVRFVSGAVDVDVGEDVQGCVPVVGGVGGVSEGVEGVSEAVVGACLVGRLIEIGGQGERGAVVVDGFVVVAEAGVDSAEALVGFELAVAGFDLAGDGQRLFEIVGNLFVVALYVEGVN